MPPFAETQALNPVFIIVIFGLLIGLSIWSWNYLKPMLSRGLLFVIAIPYLALVSIGASFALERLSTSIDETGIHYSFFAGYFARGDIKWDEVYYAEPTIFKPWYSEYTDGARADGRHDKEYAISGTIGWKIKLTDGTVIIIGTQKGNEIHNYMQYLLDKKIVDIRQLPH